MSTGKKAARVGAAAFALGVCLAGPQAAVAAADTSDDGSSASAADSKAAPSRASGPTNRAGASRSDSPARVRGAGPARGRVTAPVPTGAVSAPTDPAPLAEVAAPAAAVRTPRAAATVGARDASAATSGSLRTATDDSKPLPADSAPISADPDPSVVSAKDVGNDTAVTAVAVTGTAEAPEVLASQGYPQVQLYPPLTVHGYPPLKMSPAAPVAAKPLANLHSEVQSLFIKVTHFLADLQQNGGPLAPLAVNLEGALLIVRKTFFNHAPTLNAVQGTTTAAGLVLGTVGGYDAEGDKLTYSVNATPQFGTLKLGPDGKYVYTPGAGYTGSDSFTVKVVSDGSGINLFNLAAGRDQSAEATIKVGADGPTHPLSGTLGSGAPTAGSMPPVGLFLTAPVSISVDSKGTPAITLTVKGDTEMSWQRPGATGQITVADAYKSWDKFRAAAGDDKYVMMGVEFALPNGTAETAIFNTITASGNGDTYTFTGKFAVDPIDNTGTDAVDSLYDIIGATYKDSYENFRSRFGGENSATGTTFNPAGLDLDINSAQVYFSNYTLESYRQALATAAQVDPANTDPGVTLSQPQQGLQAAASSTKIDPYDAVTVTIDDGAGGFYEATGRGKVMHYRAAPPADENALLDLTPGMNWGSPVRAMISYGGRRPQTVAQSATVDASTAVLVNGLRRIDLVLGKNLPLRTDGTGLLDLTQLQVGTISELGIASSRVLGAVNYGGKDYSVKEKDGGRIYIDDATAPFAIQAATPTAAGTKITLEFKKTSSEFPNYQPPPAPGPVSMNLGYVLTSSQYIPGLPGLVVGLGDGRIEQWTPGDPLDPNQAQGSWKELKDQGWQSAVNVLMPYKGRPDVCRDGCDGFLVGLNNGSVQQYNEARNGAGQPGWYELQGSGWRSAVRGMVLSKTDSAGLPTFAVGLDNGAVEQWNGAGWTEFKNGNGWGKVGTKYIRMTSMMPFADGFMVGLSNGAVWQRDGDTDTWKNVRAGDQNFGTTSKGTEISALMRYGAGIAFGTGDGYVWHWTPGATGAGTLKNFGNISGVSGPVTTVASYGSIGLVGGTGFGQVVVWDGSAWTDLSPAGGFAGGGHPTTMTQIGNQLVVGLSDGSTGIWDGVKWTTLKSNKLSLKDGVLRDAVEYAKAGGKALQNGAFVADPANIFFAQKDYLQPTCVSSSKGCDATFYAFTLKGEDPLSLAGKSIALGANGQSLDLSYDIGSTDYGYVMVPNGVWKKLNPGKYAFAVLASVYTGPSVTLNLGPDGVFSTAPVDLINFDYTCNIVCSGGTGTYNVNLNVNAKVEGSLLGSDGQALTGDLNGHTYVVPGMIIAYNTGGKTFQFGAGNYIDSDYSDFKKVNGVEIKPIITPSLTLTWGLFTSPNTPIIGEVSLFDLNLGYENPISLDIDVQKGAPPSATVNSTGNITYGAGILDTIFPFLDYQGSLQVYSYTSPNLLGGGASSPAGSPVAALA